MSRSDSPAEAPGATRHHEEMDEDDDVVFEPVDVEISANATTGDEQADNDDEDEEEEAWDEVEVPQDELAARPEEEGIEIVLSKEPSARQVKPKRKKNAVSQAMERMIRHERHKFHLTCLLVSGMIRNRWINDRTLQARMLSLVPLSIQNSFTEITKANYPNERDRSRLFDAALKELVKWWYDYFEVDHAASLVRRAVDDVEAELENGWSAQDLIDNPQGEGSSNGKSKRKVKRKDFATQVAGEVLRSPNSLAKKALYTRIGSRDVMAILFTCICRALDVPARLVFSLQPVDWRPPSATVKSSSKASSSVATDSDGTPKSKGKGKAKTNGKRSTTASANQTDSGESSWEDSGRKINYKPPPVNLRRSKTKKAPGKTADASEGGPPIWWTEVYERMNRQWITIDPVRCKTRCRDAMAPSKGTVENALLYVVAYEEDGSVRDVTPRYAKNFTTTIAKARVPSKKDTNWFADLLKPYERSFKLNRDREEEEELWNRQSHEPMPTSLAGFKNHPTYILEQHLKRDEAIRPGSKKLGTFKGEEAVYARSSVVQLKSAENYWRIGRVVKENEIPMKWVKQRNVTINKRREEEARRYEGQAPSQQPLYAEDQTELFRPPPIGPDGKVPKNSFGNVDLFVPTMLPEGAAHVPHKGSAKVAKELGIDYAEAITGFEFRQRRAIPVITGIVVARESAEMIEEAVLARAHADFEKEQEKKRDRVLKRWKKLITGLRIRQRLQESYESGDSASLAEGTSQLAAATKSKKRKARDEAGKAKQIKKVKKPVKEEAADDSDDIEMHEVTSSSKKKSTSGRTLRFTMSTEERALAKEAKQKQGN